MSWLGLLFAISAISVPHEEYRARREKLRQALPNSAIILAAAEDRSAEPRQPLLQEPNFLYLTGWQEPGAVLLILPASHQPNEILYLPPRNESKERYEGRRLAPTDDDAPARTGIAAIRSTDLWEADLPRLTAEIPSVYTLKNQSSLNAMASTVAQAIQGRELGHAGPAIARIRMIKSPTEVALIQRAIDVSLEAHRAAWSRTRPDLSEFQIAATMTHSILEQGCERHAYRPVVASGPNSVILHYGVNSRRFDRGELLLMDVGAECASYAADITRTIPVSGKFTPRQRELYNLVLGAQQAAIDAVKPGASIGPRGELLAAAKAWFDNNGQPINGKPLSSYMTHGIGHHVGLEVHDAWDPTIPLAPGMVITIEPGLYIPEENTGIRIEDIVLVTPTGAQLLSSRLTRDPAAIEKSIGKKRAQ